jgi:hypothetical protein
MIWEFLHWGALAVGTLVAFTYFRDLGDITQGFLNVKRGDVMFAIRHERSMIAGALLATAVAGALLGWQQAGVGWAFTTLAAINLFMIGFPWIWLHVGLRNQQDHARYYSIDEARAWLRPEESVIVLEHNGHARAHSDYHIKRPHLAGTPDGLGGENVILTYCCLTHLGLGFKPEIDGEALDLEVLAQYGNNLIMRDQDTREPIQQVYGTRECDGRWRAGMQQWPTFRMTFRAFEKAFPDGEVFLNRIVAFRKNPLLCVFDNFVEAVFLWGTVPHHHAERLLFETMEQHDDRLPQKALVWGFNVGRDSIAFTEEFIRDHGDLVNTTVGGKAIVAAYDPDYESLGVYYNDTGAAIERIDFWGESERGSLRRVETVKAGLYWCVWANYYPETRLNESLAEASDVAA